MRHSFHLLPLVIIIQHPTIIVYKTKMKFLSIASLIVLASSASAFVPAGVPLRTGYVV